jgi:hypothetical protein
VKPNHIETRQNHRAMTRIEPGEITAVLGQHPVVISAAVTLREMASGDR